MPILELAVAMITSQHPSKEALPAKQRPEVMPIIGTRAESWAKRANVVEVPPEPP